MLRFGIYIKEDEERQDEERHNKVGYEVVEGLLEVEKEEKQKVDAVIL